MVEAGIQNQPPPVKSEPFYDQEYSIGFGRRLRLWFEGLWFNLSSLGGVGGREVRPEKKALVNDKNNDKRKAAQIVVLPPATSIRGDIVTDGDVKFHGRLRGNIISHGAFVIGRGGVIRGNVQAQVCAIGGKVIGNVRCTGAVEIMDSGYLRGDIEASESVLIKGRVRGNIHSETKASLMATANVVGDVESPRIRIDAGADFRGRVNCESSEIMTEE